MKLISIPATLIAAWTLASAASAQVVPGPWIPNVTGPSATIMLPYSVVDLGPIPDASLAGAQAINGSDDIVGFWDGHAGPHAFLRDGHSGGVQGLGPFVGVPSQALGLNVMGDAVGVGRDDRGFERAFFLARGSRRPRWLPTLGGAWSVARAVNENRQVVGVSQTATWAWEAFVEDPGGTMRSLGRLGNMEASEAVSINEHGVIVGVSGMLLGIDFHGFVYDRGVMDDLCPWPRSPCGASDINDAGEIAGWYVQFNSPAAYPYPVGVVWLPTSIGRLGAMIPALPGCQGSRAYALNNKSQAVGFSGDRAILWDSRNGTRDLNTMIPAGSGWTLRFALDISDTGHIVGVGELAGRWHSFLLR